MTVLCTDKTGTLTSARIVLAGHPGPDGIDRPRVLELAAVNSGFESRLKSPLDDAILAVTPASARAAWTFIADVPFDFDRRRASVLAARDGERMLIVKGAPEEVLALSTQVDGEKGTVPIDPERRVAVATLIRGYAAQGLRCLGIAWRAMGDANLTEKDERDLVFAGLCVFADPPKPDAGTAIRRLEAAGVRVKIVSGDAPETVLHLVGALGLKARGVLTGKEIAALNETALALKVRTADVFARVSPDQKTRVIRALQAAGDVVGFIGDGINDAPALHASDVGLAVEGAAEVARAAADIIMLESGLGVIAAGVEEGRRTDANIRKYLRMGTSSNFGNMLSMAVASLFIPFLPMTPVQVLLNNLLYDLSEVGIPYDAVERAQLRRPYGFEMRELLRFTLIMGPLSSLFDIGVFVLLLQVFHVSPEIFRTAWFAESIATQVLVVFVIRTAVPVWKGRPHPWLIATSLGALAVALGVALTPLGRPFGFVPVPLPVVLALFAVTAAYLVSAEAMKASAMKHLRRRREQRA
jgi:Mg2+-importing ATPase